MTIFFFFLSLHRLPLITLVKISDSGMDEIKPSKPINRTPIVKAAVKKNSSSDDSSDESDSSDDEAIVAKPPLTSKSPLTPSAKAVAAQKKADSSSSESDSSDEVMFKFECSKLRQILTILLSLSRKFWLSNLHLVLR